MARKKQKKSNNSKQTPNSYISSGKARLLPIGNCFINAQWKEAGLANIIVSRKHVTGNITYGVYLVDVLWKGVVDTDVRFNVPAEDLNELFGHEVQLIPVDYNEAHNIIYGAEAFAADFDIKAHRDFELSRMILEEDDDRVPIIDIEFGKDGKPFKIIRMDDQGYDEDDDLYDGEDYEIVEDDNNNNAHQAGYRQTKDEVSSDYNTGADDDWRQEIIDTDPTPILSGWTRTQWEDFITDPKSRSAADPFVDQVLLYIFDRCFIDTNLDPALDWGAVLDKTSNQVFNISSQPVITDDYMPSAEEQKLQGECYQLVEEGATGDHRQEYKQKIQQLLAGIERWPGNRQLYNALQNIYILSGEEKKLEELLARTAKLFPGYLFGLVNYAGHNLRNGKETQVPVIMKRAYTITDLYPGRSVFHVSEIFSFNQIWFEYFAATKQMLKGRHYRMQLQENVPPEYSGMKKLRASFEAFDIYCRAAIKIYLDQASQNKDFRTAMIDILLKYSN
jgi:hypothetical protein